MMKIYGTKHSSARRCHWLAEELGFEFDTVSVDIAGGQNKSPEFLALNPNGKLPVLVDDDFVIYESFAINAYLAEKFESDLIGTTLQERSLINQWNCWALANLSDAYMILILQTFRKTSDDAGTDLSRANIDRFLKVLDGELSNKTYLVSDRFTLADLNVSSIVTNSFTVNIDLSKYPNVEKWVNLMLSRPALAKLNDAAHT